MLTACRVHGNVILMSRISTSSFKPPRKQLAFLCFCTDEEFSSDGFTRQRVGKETHFRCLFNISFTSIIDLVDFSIQLGLGGTLLQKLL